MFGQMTKNLSVSTALPGPTIAFQLPSPVDTPGVDHLRTAGVAMGDQHRIAAIGRQRAQRR